MQAAAVVGVWIFVGLIMLDVVTITQTLKRIADSMEKHNG